MNRSVCGILWRNRRTPFYFICIRAATSLGRLHPAIRSEAQTCASLRTVRIASSSDLLLSRLLKHFGVDGDGDFIADYTWAVGDAEFLASDFGTGVNADTLIAPGILDGSAWAIDIQSDFFGDPVNGQVTDNFEFAGSDLFDLFGLKSYGREALDIEEMIAAEIFVAGSDARVHGVDVNGDVHGRFGDVLIVELDGALHAGKCAADGGNRQMLYGKLRGRMRGIDLPVGSSRGGGQRKNRCESGGECDARENLAHGCYLLLV